MASQTEKVIWKSGDVRALIDAYKEEQCLYAVKDPNYHNKHLRAEALERVASAVRVVRPDTSAKDCTTKFHNLRNQFNVENSKVKASVKSGIGAKNVYKPSLWYFELLKFLEEHVIPRKSITSPASKAKNTAPFRALQDDNTEEILDATAMDSHFSEDGHLNVFVDGDSERDDQDDTQFFGSASPEIITPNVVRSPVNSAGTSRPPLPSSSLLSPSTSTSSGISSLPQPPHKDARVPKKRKTQSDSAYIGAIESIADSLRQPIVIPENTVTCTTDAVGTCMSFIGSILRGFISEELRLEVMNELIQTVINARTSELNRK